jgi:hypothetical protein
LTTVDEHLRNDRQLDPSVLGGATYPVVDEVERIATFYLWNLSGQLVGYQHYRPDADKHAKNSPREGRYYTYVSDEGRGHHLTTWGLESLTLRPDLLFVTEGIFKAVPFHNRGFPCVAAITNNARPIRELLWITSRGRRVCFVGDNDEGGSSTRSLGYQIVFPPSHVKDVDDLVPEEFDSWVGGIVGDP